MNKLLKSAAKEQMDIFGLYHVTEYNICTKKLVIKIGH
jgi:hypothetical protein